MKYPLSFVLLVGVFCVGCATSEEKSAIPACAGVDYEYSPIASDTLSIDSMIDRLASETDSQTLLLLSKAAASVEKELALGSLDSLEDIFYRAEIAAFTLECGENGDFSAYSASMAVESIAGALVSAGRLREMSEGEVDSLIPSSSRNLSSRVNYVVLAAACKEDDMPLLAQSLRSKGLRCFGALSRFHGHAN